MADLTEDEMKLIEFMRSNNIPPKSVAVKMQGFYISVFKESGGMGSPAHEQIIKWQRLAGEMGGIPHWERGAILHG